jgi:glycosyltransferase involved in cell wall biosynthesis
VTKKICFFGVDNYRMLSPATRTMPVNGEAVQHVLLARAFKSLGYSVSMVVRAGTETIEDSVDGIRILTAFKWDAGLPVVRFFHPMASGVIRALVEADADIYYQSPAGAFTGLTAAYCRWKNKKFVFRVASDVNCVPGEQLIKRWRDRKLFEYGLRRADVVAVQSNYQRELLQRNYGLESDVVNMAMEMPAESTDMKRNIDIIWVSNLRPVKRAERVLSLARSLPNAKFVMIGGPLRGDEAYFAEIERSASKIANVEFLGQRPYGEVNELIARSRIFLNTSDVEGFPNTFLQAWAREVPVVSFFDPDQIIARKGLGARPENDDEMRRALIDLLDNVESREQIGAAAREYALANFSAAAAAKRYIELTES